MATVLEHPFGTTAFGDFLRTAREQRGLTLQQISNETKIPRRLLESLEHGDLGAVPAGMYQRAEIRAYAKAVGLDQTVALSELERALAMRSVSGERDSGTDGAADSLRHRSFLIMALATAVAVIAVVAWYERMTPRPAASENRIQAPPSQPVPRTDPVATVSSQAVDRGADALPPQPIAARGDEVPPARAAEPPASPATAWVTELAVVTDPPGARVIVDGIGRGTTPVTIRYLSAGEKRVRVLKDGFPAQERTVRLAPAARATTVVIPLQGVAQ